MLPMAKEKLRGLPVTTKDREEVKEALSLEHSGKARPYKCLDFILLAFRTMSEYSCYCFKLPRMWIPCYKALNISSLTRALLPARRVGVRKMG